MDKQLFSQLMDDLIVRENLEGNTAAEPKKKVQIMVCADFEDSSEPVEKFYTWMPVPLKMLPKFRLCHPAYWKDEDANSSKKMFGDSAHARPVLEQIRDVENQLSVKLGAARSHF